MGRRRGEVNDEDGVVGTAGGPVFVVDGSVKIWGGSAAAWLTLVRLAHFMRGIRAFLGTASAVQLRAFQTVPDERKPIITLDVQCREHDRALVCSGGMGGIYGVLENDC